LSPPPKGGGGSIGPMTGGEGTKKQGRRVFPRREREIQRQSEFDRGGGEALLGAERVWKKRWQIKPSLKVEVPSAKKTRRERAYPALERGKGTLEGLQGGRTLLKGKQVRQPRTSFVGRASLKNLSRGED